MSNSAASKQTLKVLRVGLLNAYPIENEATRSISTLKSFENYFDGFTNNQIQIELVEYRVAENQFPESLDDCDAYLMSGSPNGVYQEHDWIKRYLELIPRLISSNKKIVAICFGHQILAHALGGQTSKSDNGWMLGPNQFEIKAEKEFMIPKLESPHFMFSNQDQVNTLPIGAELIAGSKECPHGMFTITDQVLAMQFHPEFTEEMMLERVDKFRYSTDYEWLAQVREDTLQIKTSGQVIKQWIYNFLDKSN